MKKRTLVCFLIFLLCVFHSTIPDTVFGQEADPTPEQLAQQVFDKHNQVLRRASVKQYLPEIIEGLKTSTLPILNLIDTAIALIKSDPTGATLKGIAAAQGVTLTDDHIAIIADSDVQKVLQDDTTKSLLSLTGDDLAAGLDELLRLINEADAIDPGEETKPDPVPPTISITTPRPTTPQQGSFNVAFAASDVNEEDTVTVTASISVEPVTAAAYYRSTLVGSRVQVTQTAPSTAMPTIPGATVTLTLTANDGTADSTPASIVVTFAEAELPPKPPDKPDPPKDGELPTVDLTDSNLKGTSRLGGLSLNRVHGRAFIRGLILNAAGQGVLDALDLNPDELVEPVVDNILAQVPKGFLPKKQIRQILTGTQPWSIFNEEKDSQLDFENFGNAITPSLVISDFSNINDALIANEVKKYLTSDNLNIYVRVPSTLLGGNVQFGVNGYKAADATRITPLVFQQDTIPYTFRLDETLAATNLPALPDADFGGNKIFSGVVLRYSQTGIDGEYIAVDMEPMQGEKGVVWVSEIGIPPPKEAKDPAANIFYYFEVTLSETVTLEVINPEALGAAANSVDGTFDPTEVGQATKTYEIDSWAMPDPKNLQLQDRGLFKELFTPDVVAKLAPIAISIQTGQKPTGQQQRQLLNAVLNSANNLFTRFEETFDPMLVSVFSLPYVDIAKESLWYANLGDIADGEVNFEARVMNANGEVVDHIAVNNLTADDSAPEADINIGTAEHATGYWNSDDVFVSTANPEQPADTPALVNITSTVTKGAVGHGEGYLVYQIIKLDEYGRPLSAWMPLTVQNSMFASEIWDLVIDNLPDNLKEFPIPGSDQTINISAFPLDFIISALQGDVPIPGADIETVIIDAIEDIVGIRISEHQYALLANILGAVVDDINLFPIASDPSRVMTMPIQGENLPLLLGNYGIRAMGIDSLFNIGSHVGPTRLRVVTPEYDKTSVTMASLGDLNGDGDADESYESGVIYVNATDVTLTIAVNERSGKENHGTAHPATIMVQYENADGEWVTIGDPIALEEGMHPNGTIIEHAWTVSDFDDLIGAGDTVQVRTVTTNGLQLTDMSDPISIQLDPDVHPVDPKVLAVDVLEASLIDDTNPDSGAPQGEITLIAYTPRRTVPETTSLSLEVQRPSDGQPIELMIDTDEMDAPVEMSGVDTAAYMFNNTTLGEIYPSDASMIHIDETSSYLKWTITVDTTMLADTIDMSNLAAAHAASNPDGKSYVELDTNRYMVRAEPVFDGEPLNNPNETPAAEGETYTDTFSVDNVDDVAPLGQNMIVVSQDDIDVTPNEDGSFTVGGLVDKYDPEVDSPVITLMITPGAKRDTYETVKLYTSLPDGAIIGDVAETATGSGEFEVMIDVGTLMNEDGQDHTTRYLEDHEDYHPNPDEFIYNPKGMVFSFTAYALSEDETGNEQDKDNILNADLSTTTAHEITVNVQNTYRPDPGVLAISIVNSDGMVNPDSGAPQGELTISAYTYGITSAPTEGIRVEAQRPNDDTWERITGTATPATLVDVSEIAVTDLSDILTGSANAGITNSGVLDALVGISEAKGETPANLMKWTFTIDSRDLAKLDADAEAIKLDDTINRGDGDAERDVTADENQYVVRAYALTPKNLAQVEYPKRDEYLERGGVEAHLSLDNVDDVPPLGPTLITDISDVAGSLAASEDGIYPEVITVGGIVDPGVESPVAIFTIQPTAEMKTYEGGQIRLVQTAPDGTETLLPPVHVDEGQITVDVGVLPDGIYMYYALVGDNVDPTNWQVQGELDKPSPVVSVNVLNISVRDIYDVDDNLIRENNITDLTVTAVDGASPDRLPLQETVGELEGRFPLKESISVSFNVNNGSLTVDELTGVLVDGHESTFAAGSDAENAFSLMGSELSALADGWYTPQGRITKRNGSVTFPLATINLDNTGPMIVIEIPTEGATVSDLPTLLASFSDGDLGSGVSDGSGVSAADTVVVSLARLRPEEVVQDAVTINVDQDMVEQNLDSVVYTRIDQLAGGAYQFTVSVEDRLGNSEPVTVTFAVEGDDPVVVVTAPASGQTLDFSPKEITGFFSGGGEVTITNFTINGAEATATVDGSNFAYAPVNALAQGDHIVEVEVTDGSGVTAQTALTFTVDTPGPTVAIHAVEMYDISKPVIKGEFSGDAEIVSLSLTLNGESVTATEGDGTFEFTPAEPLDDGEFTLVAVVTDANDKIATATAVFNIRLPVPTVSIHSPVAGDTYNHAFSQITGEFTGYGEVTVNLMLNDTAVDSDDIVKQGNSYSYTLADKLPEGDHKVVASVTDANGNSAQTSAVFSVSYPDASVSIDSPAAGMVYDHTFNHISGEFTGIGEVSVTLMVDNTAIEAMVAGNEFTHTLADKLTEGEHTVSVSVMDENGETAEASTTFSVVYPDASVSISSPVAGDTYDHTYRHISGEFSGVGEVTVTLMVDGTAVDAMVAGNEFTHTLADKLTEGEHTVSVSVMDENGETAEASTTFLVVYPDASVSIDSPAAGMVYDHTFNHISGEFTGIGEVSVTLMVDNTAIEAMVAGNEFTHTLADKLTEGEHTVSVSVMDENGETAEASTTFSVVYPDASVSISSPVAGDTYDHTYRHISGEFSGVGEVSVTLMVDDTAVEAVVDGNQFTHTLADKLAEGNHTVSVMITDANSETASADSVFSIAYPDASVILTSPTAGHSYTHGSPVISGEFTGVGDVDVKLTVDGKDTKVSVDGNQFTGELAGALGHGMHTVAVEVKDANGESAMTSAEFMVDLPAPTVAILSPAPGQTYGNGEAAVIRVEFSGMDASVTSFTINGDDVEVEPEDNMFMHTPEDLITGEYVVAVEVTDAANKKTAMDTVVFNVKLDATPPVIAEVAPSGTLKNTWVNISVVVSDDQSDITAVDFFIRNEADTHKGFLPLGTVIAGAQNSATTQQIADGNILTQGSFADGTHTLKVVATSEGGKSSHIWSFTVVTDNIKPTITSITPSGTFHAGLPTISASAHDESGVAEIVIAVMDSSGETVEGKMQNDDEEGSVGITRADFLPEMPLDEGTYSIEVRATDTYGNTSSAKGGFTIDFDTAAPLITSSSPQNGARLMYAHDDEKRPTISITYGDTETGVNVDSIRFIFNDKLINLTDDQKSATQVIYRPPADLEPGQYTVKIEVSDNAQMQGNVSDESDGAREANTAVYEFSFFVEHGDVPILRAAPFNYPNPFKDNTRISFVLARRSNVSITIYDVTSRPVRVLVDNEIMEAGYYTPAADSNTNPVSSIGWDGKSSNGEDLARGIYFCQIMVTDGVEPEYAFIKLALTR